MKKPRKRSFSFVRKRSEQTALLAARFEGRSHVAWRRVRRGREHFGFYERSEIKDLVIRDRTVLSTNSKNPRFGDFCLLTYLDLTLTFVRRFLSSFGRRMIMRPFFSVAIVVSGSISSGSMIVRVNEPQKSSCVR